MTKKKRSTCQTVSVSTSKMRVLDGSTPTIELDEPQLFGTENWSCNPSSPSQITNISSPFSSTRPENSCMKSAPQVFSPRNLLMRVSRSRGGLLFIQVFWQLTTNIFSLFVLTL